MRNSNWLQEKYYNRARAKMFDQRRVNSNHYYKIEVIETFFENYVYNKKRLRVMELGGGTGLHAEHFLRNEWKRIQSFVFSDLSREMLKVARKRLNKYDPKIEFIQSPAETVNISEKMDCIYISGAMHHFENPEGAIENSSNILAPGRGIMIVCEPVITNPYALIRVVFQREEYGQFRVTSKNVKTWLKKAGYNVLDERYLHYRSNSNFFRWLLKLEKIKVFNWSAVMFCIVARKNCEEE